MRAVLECSGLRPLPRMVLMVLADAANGDGVCWPGIRRIMRRSGASYASVCRALAVLERAGWIVVDRQIGRSNRYRLTLDQSARRTGDQSHPETGDQSHRETRLRLRPHPSHAETPPVSQRDTNLSGTVQRTTDSTQEVGTQRRTVVVAPPGGAGR